MPHLKKNKKKTVITIENLLVIQENEFSVTKSMHPLKMQLLYTHANKLVTSNVIQLHILICMLNITICRTCPDAELVPVSPTITRVLAKSHCDLWVQEIAFSDKYLR